MFQMLILFTKILLDFATIKIIGIHVIRQRGISTMMDWLEVTHSITLLKNTKCEKSSSLDIKISATNIRFGQETIDNIIKSLGILLIYY
jgi:hypothetical protein